MSSPSGSSSDENLGAEKQHSSESPQRPKPLYASSYDHAYAIGLETRKQKRKWLGLDPNRPLKPHEAGSERFFWCRVRTTLQEPFSEFLGTFVLALFYMGSVAQSTLGAGLTNAPAGMGYGTFNSVPWA